MLRELRAAGFATVVATPHMRPGLFDNDAPRLRVAYAAAREALASEQDLPALDLASEHYFDDVVFARLLDGTGLPYPGQKAVLLEFYESAFPPSLERRFFDLRRRGLLPVIAHPERYQAIWRSEQALERLLDAGAVALLDSASLVGKYGRRARRCAEALLDKELYHAACSDAHRPADVGEVARSMEVIRKRYGDDELTALFVEGPREILAGTAKP